MSDRALSETAMLTSLRDIRLPVDAAGGLPADVAVTVGLAALAALIIAGTLRVLSQRKKPARPVSLQTRLTGLSQMPDGERRIALLHLLRAHAPDRYAALRGDLYVPGGGIDLGALEAEVRRLA